MVSSEIWCAIISGVVTLTVSIGTWYTSTKKERDKTKEELKKLLNDNHTKTQANIEDLKDDIAQVNAIVRQQTAVVDLKLQTLSDRVEKHNNVIERVFKLEQKVEDLEKIKEA